MLPARPHAKAQEAERAIRERKSEPEILRASEMADPDERCEYSNNIAVCVSSI